MDSTIPEKTNRVLNLIILGLLLILIRVWYLSIIQHEVHVEKARKPKRRTVVEKMERASIRDRFNIPLALNKIQYNAALCYADIRQIPANRWEINGEGKRVRVPVRLPYIKKLSEKLAEELNLDAQSIEDTIHGRASLFPHTPFIIKEDLSEEEYYRLKFLEKDWAGIRTEKGSKRYYPLGKVGSDVIGYMGAISSSEYYRIANELKTLQTYLEARESGEVAALPKGFHNPLEVRERFKALQEKAYTIHDLIGKSGVEGAFDADLKGYAGKKIYEVDTKGNLLRELPGSRKGVSGQRLLLSISAELQEFAEELLAHNEKIREIRHPNADPDLSTPWIKGGAIVALDPNTAEVLALASYPRLNPSDFVSSRIPDVRASRQAAISKWLENETYIGEIWDGKVDLERERYDLKNERPYEELLHLNLDHYLETILTPGSKVLSAMKKIETIEEAISFERQMQTLLELSGQEGMPAVIDTLYAMDPHRGSKIVSDPEKKKIAKSQLTLHGGEVALLKRKIDPFLEQIQHNDDKLLFLDLCRLIVREDLFPSDLPETLRSLSLKEYRLINQSISILQSHLQSQIKTWFHKNDFQSWRETHFKEFLKQKRAEEKEKKQPARPYTDYLEQMEKQMFKTFWQENNKELLHTLILAEAEDPRFVELNYRPEILEHKERVKKFLSFVELEQQKNILSTFRSFDELTSPLYGKYRLLRNEKGMQLEKHLAAAFYPTSGYGYGRSQAFRQSTPQGSVFKLVVAYQALLERYEQLSQMHKTFQDINPLTLIDNLQWHQKKGSVDQVLGYTLDGKAITRLYKGGKLPRSSHANIGRVDITGAIEQSSNIYFSLLAAEQIADPLNLVDTARNFGFGEKTGIELPGEIAGTLPSDVTHNKTGLYAFAIGQHSLVVTPLQTAVMLSAIANKGKVLKPKIVQVIAGQEKLDEYRDPFSELLYPFKESLDLVGIHFPLFSSTQSSKTTPYVWYGTPEVKKELLMPQTIRDSLIEGMHRVILGAKGTGRPAIIRSLAVNPQWMHNFQEIKQELIGKTGTAEILYKQSIDSESEAKIQNHIWFGGIAFAEGSSFASDEAELVVVVYLRFSEAGGKEAAPLAAEMIKKWREICKRHGKTAYVLPSN